MRRAHAPIAGLALAACSTATPPSPPPRHGDPPASASARPPARATAASATPVEAPVSAATPGAPRPLPPRYRRGKVAWAQSPADHLVLLSVAPAGGGGVWLVGNNEVHFATRDDLVVERLEADGTSRWQTWGDARWGRGVASSADGVWFLSEIGGRLRFSGQALDASDQRSDLGIVRVRADGRGDFVRAIATPDFDRAEGLAAMPDGGAVIAHGAFVAPVGGSIAFTMVGSKDTLVTRIGPAGEILWLRNLGVAGYDEATALVTDSHGNVFVGGTRWDSADTTIYTQEDAAHRPFVARLDPTGAVTWVRELRRSTSARLSHLAVLSDGQVVFAGTEPKKGALASPGAGRAFIGRLGADGEPKVERASPEVDCLAVVGNDAVLAVSRGGIVQLDDASAETREVVAFDPAQVLEVRGCASGGAHALFVSGQVKPGGLVAGVAVAPPRTVRAPKWMSSYEEAFVARIDLAE